eukprot:scaffold77907_cov30-Tisochrysis_lutea.AAC.1
MATSWIKRTTAITFGHLVSRAQSSLLECIVLRGFLAHTMATDESGAPREACGQNCSPRQTDNNHPRSTN